MVTRSANNIQKEICPEVELLNQACLDMVAQKENTRLKKVREKGNGSGRRSRVNGK